MHCSVYCVTALTAHPLHLSMVSSLVKGLDDLDTSHGTACLRVQACEHRSAVAVVIVIAVVVPALG
jgi:hypothetical protein